MHLCHNHEYFYQIQGQLAICEKKYYDFVCWTPHGIHVERILADPSHFNNIKIALDVFFFQVLLPLLLTRRKQVNSIGSKTSGIVSQPGANTSKDKTYCWRDTEYVGQLIACDNRCCSKDGFTLSVLVSPVSLGESGTVLNHASKTLLAHTTEYI